MSDILTQYATFVDGVTSEASKNDDAWFERLAALKTEFAAVGMGGQISRLTTAAIGLNDESGEFLGIMKKVMFHGKPMTADLHAHLCSELSDVLWYAMNGCIALGISMEDVIIKNVNKLSARYPGGFSIERSENRAEGDI